MRSEFSTQTKASSLIGDAFRSCIANAKSRDWHNRLSKVIREIMQLDAVNPRGQRGVIDDETSLLEGFDFNSTAKMGSVLYAQPTTEIDRVTGNCSVTVPAINPAVALAAPEGATHYRFLACSAQLDFEAESVEAASAESVFVAITNTAKPAVVLAVNQAANAAKPIALGLGIEFYQEVNGQKYLLQNGSYNPFQIVKVDTGVE
jgi:hypothetical protein